MTEVDFYELLQVDRGADGAAIKSSYRKLAMEFHPDRNPGDEAAEAKFKSINQAYECLKDPKTVAVVGKARAMVLAGFLIFSRIFSARISWAAGAARAGRAMSGAALICAMIRRSRSKTPIREWTPN
jgi:curved DNA-binding protein CbpA